MNVKSFYGSIASASYLQNAIDTIEEEAIDGADLVLTGPPTGGQDSDVEFEDEDCMEDVDTLPQEVSDELDIFLNTTNDVTERLSSSNGKNVTWIRTHLTNKTKVFNDEKKEVTKALLEKCPDLATCDEYGMFLKVFDQIRTYIIEKNNLYASYDLMTKLTEMGYRATGTVRENRLK